MKKKSFEDKGYINRNKDLIQEYGLAIVFEAIISMEVNLCHIFNFFLFCYIKTRLLKTITFQADFFCCCWWFICLSDC